MKIVVKSRLIWRLRCNGWHKTRKGMLVMNYQDTQQFERATMPKLPIQPLLVLCGVMPFLFIIIINSQLNEK